MLLAVWSALLVAVILFKLPFLMAVPSDEIRIVNLIPLQGSFDAAGELMWREIACNAAFFAPLGVYVSALTNWTAGERLLVLAGVSLTLEVAQFALGMGVSDVTDVLANTAGGGIGTGLHAVLAKTCKTKTALAVNSLGAAGTILALAWFASLLAMTMTLRGGAPW